MRLPGRVAWDGRPRVLAGTGRTSPVMLSKTSWARAAALTTAIAFASGVATAQIAAAQESPSVGLEQARSGEDGTTGAGATSGGFSTGNAKRDKNGNGSTASAGDAGDTGNTETSDSGSSESLPPNADVLAALGVLDDAQAYNLDILTGLDIPVEMIPSPPAETAPAPPPDINTGGQGESSSISTEPGSGSAPAEGSTDSALEGGSTNTAAEDGTGSTATGEPKHDRPRHKDEGTTTDGGTETTTDGGTDTSSDTGS
jgi:hypothetical protein